MLFPMDLPLPAKRATHDVPVVRVKYTEPTYRSARLPQFYLDGGLASPGREPEQRGHRYLIELSDGRTEQVGVDVYNQAQIGEPLPA